MNLAFDQYPATDIDGFGSSFLSISVTLTALILPRACYCFVRKYCPQPFYFGPWFPLVPENLPKLSSVYVWIGAGDQDPIIPACEAHRLVELLRRAGADVTIRFASKTETL